MARSFAHVLFLAAFIGGAGAACDRTDRLADGEVAWTTTVDSAGDTVQVRIVGEVPPAQVRRLVTELQVGAEDGTEEESFGEIAMVIGAPGSGLYVLDAGVPAVRLFDSTGTFVRTIGGKGSGPGEYGWVNGIVRLPDDRLALWDAAGRRVNVYAADGAFASSWLVGFSRTFGYRMFWADSAGHLYAEAALARDPEGGAVTKSGLVRMDASGAVLDSMPYLEWHKDATPARAQSADGGQRMTWAIPFAGGNESRLLPSGGLVSGYGDPYVFYIITRGQKPVRVEREHAPVPVSETESRERRAMIEFRMRRVDPTWSWSGTPFPTTKAPYQGLAVGRDGRIWVEVATAGEPIPEGEMPEREKDEPPPYTTRAPVVYDVYSPEGRLLGRVALPARLTLHAMDGNRVWGVMTDSLDIGYALRLRIEPGLPPG